MNQIEWIQKWILILLHYVEESLDLMVRFALILDNQSRKKNWIIIYWMDEKLWNYHW